MKRPIIHAVVLAAGASKRFGAGGAKLLSLWRGQPLIQHVLDRIVEAHVAGLIEEAILVHAPDGQAMRAAAIERNVKPVEAPNAASGVAASLRAGFAALPAGDAALVFLGDQPTVRLDVIERLIAQAGDPDDLLLRPRYTGAPDLPGHPVLIGRARWPLVHEATGDRGLDPVIAGHSLAWTEIPIPGTNPDVDTEGDLARLAADR